jgi:hypothetical protein
MACKLAAARGSTVMLPLRPESPSLPRIRDQQLARPARAPVQRKSESWSETECPEARLPRGLPAAWPLTRSQSLSRPSRASSAARRPAMAGTRRSDRAVASSGLRGDGAGAPIGITTGRRKKGCRLPEVSRASRCQPAVSPASSVQSLKVRIGWHRGRPGQGQCPAAARNRRRREQGHKAMRRQVWSSWLIPLLW